MERIKICEFRAQNNINKPLIQVEVEERNKVFYYINYMGDLSTDYRTLKEAVDDISNSYSNWKDFKILI